MAACRCLQVVVKRLYQPRFLRPYWVFEDGFEGAEEGWPTIEVVLNHTESTTDHTAFPSDHYDIYVSP